MMIVIQRKNDVRKKKNINKELENIWTFLLLNFLSRSTLTVLFISLFLNEAERLVINTSQFPMIKFMKNILSNTYALGTRLAILKIKKPTNNTENGIKKVIFSA